LEESETEKNTLTYENKKLINEISKLRFRVTDKNNVFDNEMISSLRDNESNMKMNRSLTFSLEEKLSIANEEKKSYESFINK
jgi:hypothetical protein